MWECPDAFMLGEKKILSVSPQGVETRGIDYQNVYQSGYFELDEMCIRDRILLQIRNRSRDACNHDPSEPCEELRTNASDR